MLYLYLLLLVGPIAALTVWIDKVINTEQFKTEDFYWMVAGIEIGVFLVALKVLIDWYLTPENSHFEPLFVVTTISLALVEWARRIWSRVQQEYGLTREEQN